MKRTLAIIATSLIASAAIAQPVSEDRAQMREWLAVGDPRAVAVTIESLNEVSRRSLHDSTNRYYLTGLFSRAADYRLEEAGPIMAAFARRGDLSATDLEMTAYAAADYDSPAALTLQRALVADPRLTEEHARLPLLVALAERGDAPAADALAAWAAVEFARAEASDVVHDALWVDLPRTRSTRLLERIRAWPEPATPRGREMLAKIRARLQASQQSPDELLAFVERARPAEEMRVIDALSILGRIGTMAHRERIAQVWLGGKNTDLCGIGWAESARRGAMVAIRKRHWRTELSATTREAR